MPTKDLSGQFIVVTGANTGIGRVTAEVLAGRGADVVLACRSEERTKPVLDAIRAAGGAASFEARERPLHARAREAARIEIEGAELRAASRRRRERRVAPRAVADSPADEARDGLERRGRADVALLRDVARGRRSRRPLLRQIA